MSTTLCFIDTETTGLDPRIHQPYEVCIWREDWEHPNTFGLPHTLEYADQQALNIGGYFERDRIGQQGDHTTRRVVTRYLNGVTLVGSNPAFDAAMMTRFIGAPIWHHRLVNVAEGGMWVFGWDRPKGLADVATACRERGYEIPEPDHTAEGDVRTTRAVYEALRAIGHTHRPPMSETNAEKGLRPGECGAHYARHPSRAELVAICTLPEGHDCEHSNVLPKPSRVTPLADGPEATQ